MTFEEKADILYRLGVVFKALAVNEPKVPSLARLSQAEYDELNESVLLAHVYNPWFTIDSVRKALDAMAGWLQPEWMETTAVRYGLKSKHGKLNDAVLIISAGNIPLVGFHDFVCCFLSGKKSLLKLSKDDGRLFPAVIRAMIHLDKRTEENVRFADGKAEGFSAVIATGSDDTSRIFDYYFRDYPKIIRRNRNSAAVLDGTETDEELANLGTDVFLYFGLGCRSISKIYIPFHFDLNRIFKAFLPWEQIIQHHKYANNYEYNKTIYLLNAVPLLDNGFVLLSESEQVASPIGILFYERYTKEEDLRDNLANHRDVIQVIVGHGRTAFGQAQFPSFTDFADGKDTLKFLCEL